MTRMRINPNPELFPPISPSHLPFISRASPLHLVQVMTGMREISPRLSKYLTTWDRYKHIWDVDKDAFMRRYAKVS